MKRLKAKRLKTVPPFKVRKQSAVSPCISKLPRHRLVELLWSFAPAYQRWSESLLVEKGLSPQRLRILGSIHERGPRIMRELAPRCAEYKEQVAELFSDLSERECEAFVKTLEKLWSRLQG